MVSGSDAHGTPITVEADKRGISPREFFEHYHRRSLEAQKNIGISHDLFTHTDTENHIRVAQDFFLRLLKDDALYQKVQRQLYSETKKRFLPDRYIEGTCPYCGYTEARGDQCDNCGRLLDALDLIDPRSKIDGSKPIVRETEHFFLDLPKFGDALLEYIEMHADHWRPNVVNFTRNYIEGGLKGRAVTRDINWGVPVPLKGWEDKRIYVWFEAVMGYISASIEWSQLNGHPEAWKDWWYDPTAKIYCFIGKDNIPFHTIFWQAELMGVKRIYEDDESKQLNLPFDVSANEFMNIKGAQFSKSRNWAIWLPDILTRYDPDAIRYYVTTAMPEARDSEFSWSDFLNRNNNELVATWGNLANRVLSFAYKHWDGRVPEPGELRPEDQELLSKIEAGFDQVGKLLESVKLRAAMREAMRLAQAVNAYLDRAPWFSVIKEDKLSAATTVFTALRAIDSLKVLFSPFLPFSTEQLHIALGYDRPLYGEQRIETVQEDDRVHDVLVYDSSKASGKWNPSELKAGQLLQKPKPLYKKLDESLVEEECALLGS
jgi:methionyl-tRNA synthetase